MSRHIAEVHIQKGPVRCPAYCRYGRWVGLGRGTGWGNRAAAARGTAGGEKDKGLEIPLRLPHGHQVKEVYCLFIVSFT